MEGADSGSVEAHPRVSGENWVALSPLGVVFGSSPRERGKQLVGKKDLPELRLIPA